MLKTVGLVALIFAGGFLLYHRAEIQKPADVFRIFTKNLNFQLPSMAGFWAPSAEPQVAPQRPSDRIRVGSFRLDGNGLSLNAERWVPQVARLALEFDVLALQQTEADPEWIDQLVNAANQQGGSFKYLLDHRGDGYSILFDDRRVQLEGNHYYSVNDPESLFERPPQVAWFRCLSPDPSAAFTFTLVNYQLGPEQRLTESVHLDDLFRAVREDGRGEDDILIAGTVVPSLPVFQQVSSRTGLVRAVSESAGQQRVDMTGNASGEDIILHERATVELGQTGHFDFLRMFNLSVLDAQQVSNQNPVWAEFSVIEGERPSFRESPRWSQPTAPTTPDGFSTPPTMRPPVNKTAQETEKKSMAR